MEIDECSECIDEYSSSLIRREEFSQMIGIPEVSLVIVVIDEWDEPKSLSLFRDRSEGLLEFLRIDQGDACICHTQFLEDHRFEIRYIVSERVSARVIPLNRIRREIDRLRESRSLSNHFSCRAQLLEFFLLSLDLLMSWIGMKEV